MRVWCVFCKKIHISAPREPFLPIQSLFHTRLHSPKPCWKFRDLVLWILCGMARIKTMCDTYRNTHYLSCGACFAKSPYLTIPISIFFNSKPVAHQSALSEVILKVMGSSLSINCGVSRIETTWYTYRKTPLWLCQSATQPNIYCVDHLTKHST